MGSSGGGDDGAGMMALMGQGTPMPGLPIAGQGPGTNAFEYGQFQNFLPEIQAEGENPMATGLRPDMFKYRSPGGVVAEGSGGGGGDEIQGLRDELAALKSGMGGNSGGYDSGGFPQYGDPNATAKFMSGGRGGVGTMGMGGGGVPGIQGPQTPGANPVAQGSGPIVHPAPWWPKGGPGSPIAAAANNSDPLAAAAAAAAAKASGGA
jgi:hypothetical protein